MKKPTGLNGEPKGSYAHGYKIGVIDGRQERSMETVEYRPFAYWRWGEWFTYVSFTGVAVVAALILFWLVGCFIRWEVGPVPPIVSKWPVERTAPGWEAYSCTVVDHSEVTCSFQRTGQ